MNSAAISAYTNQSEFLQNHSIDKIIKPLTMNDNELKSQQTSNEINDEAIISDEAYKLFEADKISMQKISQQNTNLDEKSQNNKENSENQKNKFTEELTLDQKQDVAKLKEIDSKVKAHEKAHQAAASGINASAASFDYEIGPDGKRYAVAGEVQISFQNTDDPKSNIEKAKAMKAAAMAPAEPSSQDYAVARQADSIINEERQKLQDESSDIVQSDQNEADDANSSDDSNVKVKNFIPQSSINKSSDNEGASLNQKPNSFENINSQTIDDNSVAQNSQNALNKISSTDSKNFTQQIAKMGLA